MAGFKTHITTSSVLGVGYTGLGFYLGIPWESAILAGGLCGVGGMLPDIDSKSGVPFRESMSFAAAIVPLLMLSRFQELGLNYEQVALATGSSYLLVRFGISKLFIKYTVHRGMFHSIPAALIFAGLAFFMTGSQDLQLRYFKAGGVFIGVMSHLILDEIYSVEWAGGRWRFKRSFGTALKLWGPRPWANMSTYGKLVLLTMIILTEPFIMESFDIHPQMAQQQLMATDLNSVAPPDHAAPEFSHSAEVIGDSDIPTRDRTIYDTADRIWRRWQSR